MNRYVAIILAAMLLGPALAVEPLEITLTDVEKNVFVETTSIQGRSVTPRCPTNWTVSKFVLHGGRSEGVDVIELDNGRLRMTVVPTRGMSVKTVVMGDVQLGWDSPVKELVNPAFVNLESRSGLGWLDGFNEWLVRCGLEFFGAPGPDEFIDNTGKKASTDLTLHGKIANIPASLVRVVVDREPPYRIRVQGRVREALLHGPKLELWAEISTTPGSNTVTVSDRITNTGAVEQEFGVLYHTNHGSPLMGKGAGFVAPVRWIAPINDLSAQHIDSYATYRGPTPGVPENVFCMALWSDQSNRTMAMLHNAAADKAVSMSYSVEQLPYFTLWKNPVAIEDGYVTGLEPGTGFSRNRSVERRFGRVPKLAPGQTRSFTIDFTLHDNAESIAKAVERIRSIQGARPTRIDKEPLPTEPN